MTSLPDSARALVESGRLAHCVTINPDGGPQVSAVWIGLDGDEIVMAHMRESRKVCNLRRAPAVSSCIDRHWAVLAFAMPLSRICRFLTYTPPQPGGGGWMATRRLDGDGGGVAAAEWRRRRSGGGGVAAAAEWRRE